MKRSLHAFIDGELPAERVPTSWRRHFWKRTPFSPPGLPPPSRPTRRRWRRRVWAGRPGSRARIVDRPHRAGSGRATGPPKGIAPGSLGPRAGGLPRAGRGRRRCAATAERSTGGFHPRRGRSGTAATERRPDAAAGCRARRRDHRVTPCWERAVGLKLRAPDLARLGWRLQEIDTYAKAAALRYRAG